MKWKENILGMTKQKTTNLLHLLGKTIQPYTNQKGYYSCLFGEYLILDRFKGRQKLVLVESEKITIVGAILLPEFTWLAYGGSNGLTKSKYNCLIGHKILIIYLT